MTNQAISLDAGNQRRQPMKLLDLYTTSLLYIVVISLFLESYVLITTRMEAPWLYPIAFAFKFVMLFLALAPRLLRMPLIFYLRTWLFASIVIYATLISDQPLMQIATSVRDLTLYIGVYYIIAHLRLSRREQIFDRFMKLVLVMTFVNIAYSTYVQLGYRGDRQIFYFYNFVASVGKWADFNYFRNGIVRATGLFVSPVAFSNFMILPTGYMLAHTITKPSWPKGFALLLLLIGIAQSQTRNPFLALFLASCILALWSYVRRFWVIILSHIVMTMGSFGGLALLFKYNLLDPSAAGRVQQTNELFRVIWADWRGVGFGTFGPQFAQATDLSIITVLLTFGFVLGLLYYGLVFGAFAAICKNYRQRLRAGAVSTGDIVRFRAVFIVINAIIIMALNSNIFDGVVLALFAIILGLYPGYQAGVSNIPDRRIDNLAGSEPTPSLQAPS